MSHRLLAALFALTVATSMVMVPIPWGDSTGSVLGGISFLCELDWDFDEFPFLYERSPRGPLVPPEIRTVHPDPTGERLLSFTGLGVKLAGVPSTAVVVSPWWGSAKEIRVLRASQLTVAWTCGLILWLTWLTLRRTAGDRLAAWGAVALLFGTTLWPQLRQTMWSNQAALVGIAALTWACFAARDDGLGRRLALIAGAATGWAVMTRAATAVICLPLLAALLWEHRKAGGWRAAGWVVLAGLPFAAMLLADNSNHTGHPLRFTFLAVAADIGARMGGSGEAFSGNPAVGLAGLLVSPSRGLLVFSPFLALAAPGAVAAVRRRDPVRGALVVGVLAVLLLNAGYVDWWGASCWGPRRLMEIVPALVVLGLRPEWRDSGPPRWFLRAAPPLLAWAILVQGVGFFVFDSRWDARHEPTANMTADADGQLHYDPKAASEALWSVGDGVLLDALRRLPEQGLQFGFDNDFTLAVGEVVPAPIPACGILRTVDRYPAPTARARGRP